MSLFADPSNIELSEEPVGPGATILRSFAISEETEILSGLSDVVSKAPFRHMITPGGFRMSVAMTNCGALGWGDLALRGIGINLCDRTIPSPCPGRFWDVTCRL